MTGEGGRCSTCDKTHDSCLTASSSRPGQSYLECKVSLFSVFLFVYPFILSISNSRASIPSFCDMSSQYSLPEEVCPAVSSRAPRVRLTRTSELFFFSSSSVHVSLSFRKVLSRVGHVGPSHVTHFPLGRSPRSSALLGLMGPGTPGRDPLLPETVGVPFGDCLSPS